MGVIAAFFARLLQMCPGRLFTGLLLRRQEVRAIFKTCNQLSVIPEVTFVQETEKLV